MGDWTPLPTGAVFGPTPVIVFGWNSLDHDDAKYSEKRFNFLESLVPKVVQKMRFVGFYDYDHCLFLRGNLRERRGVTVAKKMLEYW